MCYLRLTSKQSIQLFHKLVIMKYASNMQYVDVVSCLWFVLNLRFSSLFTAVAILQLDCLSSLMLKIESAWVQCLWIVTYCFQALNPRSWKSQWCYYQCSKNIWIPNGARGNISMNHRLLCLQAFVCNIEYSSISHASEQSKFYQTILSTREKNWTWTDMKNFKKTSAVFCISCLKAFFDWRIYMLMFGESLCLAGLILEVLIRYLNSLIKINNGVAKCFHVVTL